MNKIENEQNRKRPKYKTKNEPNWTKLIPFSKGEKFSHKKWSTFAFWAKNRF